MISSGISHRPVSSVPATLPSVGRERAHGLATAGLLEHDLLAEPCTVAGGRIALPAIVALDEDALRRYTVETIGPAA